VSLEPDGSLKIMPVNPERFRKPLVSLGIVKMRLRLGENGSFVTKSLAAHEALFFIQAWRAARTAA